MVQSNFVFFFSKMHYRFKITFQKKKKKKIEEFVLTGNTNFIYKNDLDKAPFQYVMAYGKSKDLARRTQSDKVLRDKAVKIANNPKYDRYQKGLASVV